LNEQQKYTFSIFFKKTERHILREKLNSRDPNRSYSFLR